MRVGSSTLFLIVTAGYVANCAPLTCEASGRTVDGVTGAFVRSAFISAVPIRALDTQDRSAMLGLPSPSAGSALKTDGSGAFLLPGLKAGNIRIHAEKIGYLPAEQDITLIDKEASCKAELVLRMTPTGSLAGVITDSDGEPVPYAIVKAFHSRYVNGTQVWVPAAGSSTDGLGEYRLFNIPPGKYVVGAVAPTRYWLQGRKLRP